MKQLASTTKVTSTQAAPSSSRATPDFLSSMKLPSLPGFTSSRDSLDISALAEILFSTENPSVTKSSLKPSSTKASSCSEISSASRGPLDQSSLVPTSTEIVSLELPSSLEVPFLFYDFDDTGEDDLDLEMTDDRTGEFSFDVKQGRCSYELYLKFCIREFILDKLSYSKLTYLMKLYYKGMAEKAVECRSRCNRSRKVSKLMSNTIMMFHNMFEEVKKNVTLDGTYYQRMSDLIAIYIDLELKASEFSHDKDLVISGKLTTILRNYLDSKCTFQMDTILKSHLICKKFRHISFLIISRVMRNLPSTQCSDISYIRSILVFKLWICLTKDQEERTKVLKLASHLAKPPEWLMENPSQLAKEILPCDFRKSYIDLTAHIIGTPWPLRERIEKFLTRTRIKEKYFQKEYLESFLELPSNILKHADITEESEKKVLTDIKILEDLQFDIKKIIISDKKMKQSIRVLKNSCYKYTTVEELNKVALQTIKCFNDVETQTVNQEGYLNSPVSMNNCANNIGNALQKKINAVSVQLMNREDKVLPEIPMIDLTDDLGNKEFQKDQIPRLQVTEPSNCASNLKNTKEAVVAVESPNVSVQNSNPMVVLDETIPESASLSYQTANHIENNNSEANHMGASISVRSAASIAKYCEGLSSNSLSDWHIPEVPTGCNKQALQPKQKSTTSTCALKEAIQLSEAVIDTHLPPIQSVCTNPKIPEIIPDGLSECFSLPSCLISTNKKSSKRNHSHSVLPSNQNTNPLISNVMIGPSKTYKSREAILKSTCVNRSSKDKTSVSRENCLLVRDTTLEYFPPNHTPPKLDIYRNEIPVASNTYPTGGPLELNYNKVPPPLCPILINQHRNIRQPVSRTNEFSSFFDDQTIANSSLTLTKNQTVHPHLVIPCSMANTVRSQFPFPPGLSYRNFEPALYPLKPHLLNDNRTLSSYVNTIPHSSMTATSPVNMLYHQSSNSLTPDHPGMPSLSVSSTPHYYKKARKCSDDVHIHNTNQQRTVRHSEVTDAIQKDLTVSSIKLPPYSTIRKINKKPDVPLLPSTSTSINCLPVISSSQSFMPVTSTSTTVSRVTSTPSNVSLPNSIPTVLPVTNTRNFLPVNNTSTTDFEIINASNCNILRNPEIPSLVELSDLSNSYIKIDINVAMELFIRSNDLGYFEYNFKKMPIPVRIFKSLLSNVEIENNKFTESIDEIVSSLSQTNENFDNETNVPPPQLIKVNNNDINKQKIINSNDIKKHEITLKKDHLAFISQEKFRNFYSEGNEPSEETNKFYSDLKSRCFCLQCSANNIVLHVNHIILKQFRLYRVSKAQVSVQNLENKNVEKSLQQKVAEISKRHIEMNKEESDSPLPLKKRKSGTPPINMTVNNDTEISYPSTRMISIAELELLKNKMANINTKSVDNINSSLSFKQNKSLSIAQPKKTNPVDINRNIAVNTPVVTESTMNTVLKNDKHLNVPPTFCNNSTATLVSMTENVPSSELILNTMIMEDKPSKVTRKRAPGRPRKNVKKCTNK